MRVELHSANPELLQYCKNGVPLWVIKLLKKYPTAKKLSRAKVKSVAQIPFVTEERAMDVVKAAKKTIASGELMGETIVTVGYQVLCLSKTIKEQQSILVKNFSSPEADLLDRIPVVGIDSAIGMMIEIENIERFPSVKN